MRNKKIITGSHPHVNAVSCRCASWEIAATLDTSFNNVPMDLEQGQTAVIQTQRNYVFWSQYDTSGGHARGVVVTVDVPSGSFGTSSILSTVPLDLGTASHIVGIDHVGFNLYCLNLSSGASLAVIDAVSDHDNPVLHTNTSISSGGGVIDTDGADGMVIIGSPISWYVAADNGLLTFDLSSDPPTLLGTLDETGSTPQIRGIGYRSSDKVLFANAASTIRSYDLSTIGSPAALGTLGTAGCGSPRAGISVYGNVLYAIIDDGAGHPVIGIFDITDPTAMSFIDYVYSSGSIKQQAQDILALGVCLWVLTPSGGWVSYDLLDTSHPLRCTSGSINANVQGFQIGGLEMVAGSKDTPDRIYILQLV